MKSSNIRGRFLHLVSRKGDLRDRVHALMGEAFLPVPIFIGLHGVETAERADNLVHVPICSMSEAAIQSGRAGVKTHPFRHTAA